jgi:hypothetical protein
MISDEVFYPNKGLLEDLRLSRALYLDCCFQYIPHDLVSPSYDKFLQEQAMATVVTEGKEKVGFLPRNMNTARKMVALGFDVPLQEDIFRRPGLRGYERFAKHSFKSGDIWGVGIDLLRGIQPDGEDIGTSIEPMQAVILSRYLWENGKEIAIAFLDGQADQHKIVKECFEKYAAHVGLKFRFVEDKEQSDVRITFEGNRVQSCVGTKALEVGKDKPTMFLGIQPWIDSQELRGHILHEIGHMLGLGHEQSSPNCTIEWNEYVYWYYKQKCNWDPETTKMNVLKKYKPHECVASEFDAKSNMLYEVPGLLTKNGVYMPRNNDLSEIDKKMIAMVYPKVPMDLATSSPGIGNSSTHLHGGSIQQSGRGCSLPGLSYLPTLPGGGLPLPQGTSHQRQGSIFPWMMPTWLNLPGFISACLAWEDE